MVGVFDAVPAFVDCAAVVAVVAAVETVVDTVPAVQRAAVAVPPTVVEDHRFSVVLAAAACIALAENKKIVTV